MALIYCIDNQCLIVISFKSLKARGKALFEKINGQAICFFDFYLQILNSQVNSSYNIIQI